MFSYRTKKFLIILWSVLLFVSFFWSSHASADWLDGLKYALDPKVSCNFTSIGCNVVDKLDESIKANIETFCKSCQQQNKQCVMGLKAESYVGYTFPQLDMKCELWSGDQQQIELSELEAELTARKPIPRISIPGLSFSNVMSSTEDSGTYFYIPWIPELISALYKFGIAVVSIIAVAVIILQGVRIITSAGGEAKQSAYKKILQSIIGLIIAWGSFAILYNVNPNLIKFNALRVKVVERIDLTVEEPDTIPEGQYPQIPNITKPTWNRDTFDCGQKNSYTETGVLPASNVITYTCNGIKATTLPEMKDPLCKVAENAKKQGYEIVVRDGYRSFIQQADKWCGKCTKNYPDVNERNKYCAVPGFSNHGHGRAVDIMLKKAGKELYIINGKDQCKASPENVAKIASLFYDADPKFNRLETEIWHFEYGTEGQGARLKTTALPSACAK